MKTFFVRFAAIALLSSLALTANAATYVGTFLDSNSWTLIHAGSGPSDSGIGAANFLRWDADQEITFDLTGTTLTAAGPQVFSLSSTNGATAEFTLLGATFDLSGPSGFMGGSLDYSITIDSGPLGPDAFSGTFLFEEENFGGTPFNSSVGVEGSDVTVWAWGGDVDNDIGIDIAFNGSVVPIPAPLLLFASGLIGLGAMRRRS